MTNWTKQLCSLLLAMVAGVAYADNVAKIGETEYATLQEAVSAVPTDGTETTITLLADAVGGGIKTTAGQNVVIDFKKNHYTVDKTVGSTGTETNGFQLLKGSTVTLKNGTLTSNTAQILIQNYSNLTLNSMTVGSSEDSYAYVVSNNFGSLNVTGSTSITAPAGKTAFDVCVTNKDAYKDGVTVTINTSGKITGNIEYDVWEGIPNPNKAKLVIKKGTIEGTWNIETELADAAKENFTISGGVFIGLDPTPYCTDEFAPTAYEIDGETVYTTCNTLYTSATGVAKYQDFSNSISANGTYKLLKDVTVTARIVPGILAGNIIIDLNGHVLTSSASDYGILLSRAGSATSSKTYSLVDNSENGGGKFVVMQAKNTAIQVQGKYNTVTIGKGVLVEGGCVALLSENDVLTVEGTIDGKNDFAIATNGSATKNATITIKDGAVVKSNTVAVYLPGTGTTTIEGGEISGATGVYVKSGTLNITGGSVTGTGAKADYNYNGNGANSTGNAVVVDNCGYPGGDPVVSITDGKFTSANNDAIGSYGNGEHEAVQHFISGGLFSSEIPDELCVEGKTSKETTLVDGYYTIVEKEYVAQIGDKKYETLAEAVAAATAEDYTVILLADIDLGADALNIDKAITINGDGHTITSDAEAAVLLTGSGGFTLSNTKVVASKGHGIQAGKDDSAYSGALTIKENSVLTVAKRGIRVYEENTGFAINIANSTIQSNKQDPTTTYTTGNDAMAISLGTSDNKGYMVNVTNSVLQGFSYILNSVTSGSNLTVNMTGGKAYGRAVINVWGTNNTFTLDGVEVHGLNNQTGKTEGFACIVENNSAKDNVYNIKDCAFTATLSEAAQTTAGSTASEHLLLLGGTNATVKILGSTSYTCNATDRGGVLYSEGALSTNNLYFDETAKATFVNSFDDAVISESKVAVVDDQLYPVNYVPEVLYYWQTESGAKGTYSKFAEPFENGWLDNGEFIALQKNLTLKNNIACQLGSGASFNLILDEFSVTKGDYSVFLKEGVTVNADKKTDIFSAAANCIIVETVVESGYTYKAVSKEDAGIFELIDGKEYTNEVNKEAESVTYTRSFSERVTDHYQPWFVPFDYKVTDEDADNFTFYKVHMIAASDKEVEVSDDSKIYIYIEPVEVGTVLKGNKPYIIKPKSVMTNHVFKAENVTLLAKNTGSRLNLGTAQYDYDFYGTYAEFKTTDAHKWISLNVNGNVFWNKSTSSINSYRWYITVSSSSDNDDYSKQSFVLTEEDVETTGISTGKYDFGGEIEGVFTATGLKVDAPVRGWNIIKYTDGRTKKIYVK